MSLPQGSSFTPPETGRAWRPVVSNASDVLEYVRALDTGFEQAFAAAPYRARIALGGAVFDIASDVHDPFVIARNALAGQVTEAAATARLLISGRGTLPGMPPVPLWENHTYNDRRLFRKFEDTDLRLHHYRERDFWQFFDRSTARGVQLMPTSVSLPEWDAGSPLRNLIRWHLTTPTQGFVHAGTLGDDGHGVMLAGPGGSGKSGTVLAGLLAGMQSVGDDYVLARMTSEGGIGVRPIFNTLKNDAKGLDRLGVEQDGKLRSGLGFVNWQGKYQFTFQDLVARAPADDLTVHALCVPNVTGNARTSFTPISGREAFLALAQTGFEQMPGDTRHSLEFCSALIKRLPVFRMNLGTEPKEIIGALREFLARKVAAKDSAAS